MWEGASGALCWHSAVEIMLMQLCTIHRATAWGSRGGRKDAVVLYCPAVRCCTSVLLMFLTAVLLTFLTGE